ncbi:MAG: hypothetical protein M3Z25_17050 [Actinomycetota bacterium]|nr:hypothetical protein [Actinomycetota bacterium]
MKHLGVVVLDNEAVQALITPGHRKHRRVLAAVEVVLSRRKRRADSVRLVVPTAVRVEAGWDRRKAGAAEINRLRVEDSALDRGMADRAAAIRGALRVSVADAHLGAVIAAPTAANTAADHSTIAVLTSDVEDIQRIAGHLGADVTVVAL